MFFGATACELDEKIDLQINYRPTLMMDYSFLNNDGREEIDKRVTLLNCYVSDQKGSWMNILQSATDTFAITDGIRLLYGVPDGEYRICSFANLREPESGKPLDIVTTTDSLYHHIDNYTVQRGKVTRQKALLRSLFCRVNLTVEGINSLTEDECVVEISGVPAGFDYEGKNLSSTQTIVPVLNQKAGMLISNFCIYRIENPQEVTLKLRKKDAESGTSLLYEGVLTEFIAGIDMQQPDITLPIHIRLYQGGALISILDWEKEMQQIVEVGN